MNKNKDAIKMTKRQELVIKTFKFMYKNGELTPKTVFIPLQTGGFVEKLIYKVSPNEFSRKP